MGERSRALEKLVVTGTSFWEGRRVLVTGHTGFKGSWLSLWLHRLGAEVHGIALAPDTHPSLYEVARLGSVIHSHLLDIRDAGALSSAVDEIRPNLVFHLAAQALVRPSYADPAGTWATNVMGTIHLLEALRARPECRTVVVVTTDKCYENLETGRPFRESDPLGGHDPYSSSKGAAELAVASWRRSFFVEAGVGLATARAGNVIGGGDWAMHRLIPDLMRATLSGEPVVIRYPKAVRPWQHVLEPLAGYLRLAQRLAEQPVTYARAWNFGPDAKCEATVGDVANAVADRFGTPLKVEFETQPQPHEAGLLTLDSTLASSQLDWHPRMPLDTALETTMQWYRAWQAGADMNDITLLQIAAYEQLPAV